MLTFRVSQDESKPRIYRKKKKRDQLPPTHPPPWQRSTDEVKAFLAPTGAHASLCEGIHLRLTVLLSMCKGAFPAAR